MIFSGILGYFLLAIFTGSFVFSLTAYFTGHFDTRLLFTSWIDYVIARYSSFSKNRRLTEAGRLACSGFLRLKSHCKAQRSRVDSLDHTFDESTTFSDTMSDQLNQEEDDLLQVSCLLS